MATTYRICLLVVLATFAKSNADSLLKPCGRQDIECLSRSTEKFLESTSKGIPDYNITAIDPLIIPALDNEVDQDMGIVFRFKNLNVTGLRHQQISDFQMNIETKSVLLKTKADLYIEADVVVDLVKDSKQFSGIYTVSASVSGTAKYNYDFNYDGQGVRHFEVGPETITCEVIDEPRVTLSKELQDNMSRDPAAQAKLPAFVANRVYYRQKTTCAIVQEAYKSVVHNIRAAAKILPASAFFFDI